jgi:cytochrome c oxidase cbb3-type subunit III
MRKLIGLASITLAAAGIMTPQQPARPDPARSPASKSPPKTLTPQSYPVEQVRAGEGRFASECGFCHGRDAAGGETGPDLTRSQLVAEDARGDKLGPLIRAGRPEAGMPAFSLSDTDLGAIVAFIHDRKTQAETLSGGRRSVEPGDLTTGSAEAGKRYFEGAGSCSRCHSATGDLAGIATRYRGLTLLERMLYPSGRPAPKRPKATVSLASGQVSGDLISEDEFTIVVADSAGARQTYQKNAVKFTIDDPMSAHFDQLGKYTDDDMHNVFAYLDTLK